jgi:hypothetical protein
MSVARAKIIGKAQKDQGKCGRCGVELPKGSGYLWWTVGFRSNYKYKRCLKPECYPRPSERESSKFVTVLSAQENFEDTIDGLEDKEDIEAAVQEVGAAVREIAEEYREAADAWEHGNYELEEKADHYEGQADELESWEFGGSSEWDLCEEHEDMDRDDDRIENCTECVTNRDDWLSEIREEAREAVQNVEQL